MKKALYIFLFFVSSLSFFGQRDNTVYTIVEQAAEFPGGPQAMMKFIQQNITYPAMARESGISGKCFLKFIVNETGEITEIGVLKGVPDCEECDKEAVRVVKIMPRWSPAMMSGKAVKCYYNLPFSFKIGNGAPAAKKEEQNQTIDKVKPQEEVFTVVETQAEFPGGLSEMTRYLQNNLNYPVKARELTIGGKVLVKFVVTEVGSIESLEIIKSAGYEALDQEAMRVIKSMPNWKPAQMTGRNVKCYFNLPVSFALTEPYFVCNVNNINSRHLDGINKALEQKYDAAMDLFSRCLETMPNDVDALYNIAVIQHKKKNQKQACENYHAVLGKSSDETLTVVKNSKKYIEQYCTN